MKSKKGLSQVVTTIILILLIIIAIAGIWVVVDRVIIQGSNKINLEQYTINLKIVSAKINISSGIAEIRVKRNQGEGNLTGIKFIIEDPKTSEVVEEKFTRFEELAEKTFNINLIIPGSDLIISEIDKISIAPIFVSGVGVSESLGSISDSISGLKRIIINGTINGTENNETGEECTLNIDCGNDELISGTRICNELETAVLQYKKVFTCDTGFCSDENILITVELCPTETICYDGNCVEEQINCTPETIVQDCGMNDWIGSPGCQSNPEAIIQNFKTYSCTEGICESTIEIITIEECLEDESCYQSECFEELECLNNEDCSGGYVCKEGACVLETITNNGTIKSIWPFGIGEYFDSEDLPKNNSLNLVSKYILFPDSLQEGCLEIIDFIYPPTGVGISYLRLNTAPTNISDGDEYQIWETDYICSTL
jgi:hypothetical protein